MQWSQEMIIVISASIALLAAVFTTISGFGLGTIMLPVFALLFGDLKLAILLTAIVHFANNISKFFLFVEFVEKKVLFRFGITAIFGSALGALVLIWTDKSPVFYYVFENKVSLTAFLVGILMIIFAVIELSPAAKKWQFSPKFLPFGGFLSGFFGGYSGNQGAIRSMFLVKSGLSKEQIIGTGVVIACLIDTVRISSYLPRIIDRSGEIDFMVVGIASLFAIVGSIIGKKLLKNINASQFKIFVGMALLIFGTMLCFGFIRENP